MNNKNELCDHLESSNLRNTKNSIYLSSSPSQVDFGAETIEIASSSSSSYHKPRNLQNDYQALVITDSQACTEDDEIDEGINSYHYSRPLIYQSCQKASQSLIKTQVDQAGHDVNVSQKKISSCVLAKEQSRMIIINNSATLYDKFEKKSSISKGLTS